MWELILTVLLVILAIAVAAGLIWLAFQFVCAEILNHRMRRERARQAAANDLRDTILKLAYELAQSQRESTQAIIKAAGEHRKYLRREP